MPRKYNEQEAVAAFHARVDSTAGPDKCWPWTRGHGPGGYGQTHHLGQPVRAHRLAYTLAVGPIPPGMHVLHRCDNPPCCNPAHLFIGTHLDNMRDKVEKGRQPTTFPVFPDENRSRGLAHWSNKHPELRSIGTRNGHAKLDSSKVDNMRRDRAAGESFRSIARRYGVSLSTAQAAINGDTWGHIPGPIG